MANDGSHNQSSDQEAVSTKFTPGQKVFDRYTLKRVLGQGGMGVVWLARDVKLAQDVALKFLSDRMLDNANALERLKRETRHNLQLTHPNIVRIYDLVEDKTGAAIAMEYVDGWSLWAMKVDKPHGCFSVEETTEWIRQLCEALEYAHSQQHIVHRDLKPSNLLIDARGQIKVSDFGLARNLRRPSGEHSGANVTSGTIGYMSPQQAMGEESSVLDDVYSIGATIYELLTSTPPFYKGEVLAQLQELTPPSMTDRLQERGVECSVPLVWEETVARCLSKNPAQRPQSAAEILRLLQRNEQQVPRPAVVESVPALEVVEPVITEAKPKPRWLLPVAAGTVVVALAGLIVWKMPFGSAKHGDPAKSTNGSTTSTSDGGQVSGGSIDKSFNPNEGADEEIRCLAIQDDGKILVGGPFKTFANTSHRGVVRLNKDGSVDAIFSTTTDGTVHAIQILPGGQIVMGGDFGWVSGTRSRSVVRLNADGTVDQSFNPGGGADHEVRALLGVMAGKLLVGGHFTKFHGGPHSRIVRLNQDGSVDKNFHLNLNNVVWTMASGVGGKIYLGGNFSHKAGNRLLRIDADGSVDESFQSFRGVSDLVYALAPQPDGKVIIGGKFTKANGIVRNALARLNSDGSLDTAFAPSIDDGTVQAIALQSDGKIVIGGMFTSIAGVRRGYLARLNTDGSLDRQFDPKGGPNFVIRAIGVQKDKNIVLGGAFNSVDGVPFARIARLKGE
ncbi:MAG: hypothetical protein JWM68_2485 [Verrucomicrobiales bacterium]|nr:hypothetical protein [Verrucomicrobiales bacterium]